MIRVIKDTVLTMLGKILDAVKDVQTSIANINETLNRIEQQLIQIQVAQVEIDRNTR